MRKVFIHIGIAILCTAIGVSIWLYVNNLIFPAKPVPLEPDEQVLESGDFNICDVNEADRTGGRHFYRKCLCPDRKPDFQRGELDN